MEIALNRLYPGITDYIIWLVNHIYSENIVPDIKQWATMDIKKKKKKKKKRKVPCETEVIG